MKTLLGRNRPTVRAVPLKDWNSFSSNQGEVASIFEVVAQGFLKELGQQVHC